MPYLLTPHATAGTVQIKGSLYTQWSGGRALYKKADGTWALSSPYTDAPRSAVRSYRGASLHVITDAEAAEITAAGFGDLIVDAPESTADTYTSTYGESY